MHHRFHTVFIAGTFGAFLLTTSALAAPAAPTQQGRTGKQSAVRTAAPGTPVARTRADRTRADRTQGPGTPAATAPIAGILDGSNGETVTVHGRHAADGTAAKYMNKSVYLGPLGNRDTLDTPY
ncbi:TonB-dependent siderophore receptor, partial [Gluconacetobacter tumulisoli]|nr:TonB-dependent siderophore receptor [Gluconacetobacter tumulisoli]